MGEVELYELEASISDLTEVAQQVLRDEMKKRGLDRQRAASNIAPVSAEDPWPDSVDSLLDRDEDNDDEESDLPREYTWKTLLCECEQPEQAWQLRVVLKRAGIESWGNGPQSRDPRNPRILVAADQLDQAREIAARPIPQQIVDECTLPDEEYQLPVCPSCSAEDPVLEGVDPVNSWLCESCDYQWSDAVDDANVPN
jgi:hypothetical protein